jgi:uridine kinase
MLVIGISGGSCSGKSSIAKQMAEKYSKSTVIHMDNFYLDDVENFDHPDAIDFDLLNNVIFQLSSGKSVEIPQYDFKTNRRLEETIMINPPQVLIIEGIFMFYDPKIRSHLDIKIFVDVEGDIRLARRIQRDVEERGRTVTSVIKSYEKWVKPGHDLFIEPTKKYADLIIPRGCENQVAINVITSSIAKKCLNQQRGQVFSIVW